PASTASFIQRSNCARGSRSTSCSSSGGFFSYCIMRTPFCRIPRMTTFKALRVHQVEKATQARFEQISLNDLSAGDVVIRVAYSGVNYKDALAVTGKGRIMKGFPRVAGIDLSGTVESSHDARYKTGDPVLVTGCNIGEALDGGYAEVARVPAEAVVSLP